MSIWKKITKDDSPLPDNQELKDYLSTMEKQENIVDSQNKNLEKIKSNSRTVNERFIKGIKSNFVYKDAVSNPGFGFYITTVRIFGVKEVSIFTHLISPRVFNPSEDDEIEGPLNIKDLERSCYFSLFKEELKKIELKKPKPHGKMIKWTIMGDFMGLGSITFYLTNNEKYSLLISDEGYPNIKNFFEKYASQYLQIIE
jgi:hypothetical protein